MATMAFKNVGVTAPRCPYISCSVAQQVEVCHVLDGQLNPMCHRTETKLDSMFKRSLSATKSY